MEFVVDNHQLSVRRELNRARVPQLMRGMGLRATGSLRLLGGAELRVFSLSTAKDGRQNSPKGLL